MATSQALVELEDALATYKKRMAASNRAFWTAKIRSLEQEDSLTDRKRLDILARYFQESKWGTTGHGSSITKPSQLLILPGQPGYVELGIDSDGTVPPASVTSVNAFLQKLTERINEGSSEERLEVPEEYRHLLNFTDAISDLHFRGSGVAGMDGVCGGIPSRYHLSDMCYSRDFWEDDGWTVLGGWQTGIGDAKATQLLYGMKESGTPDEQEFAWRVYAVDGPQDHDRRWFSSIAAFLLFRADWLERMPAGWENVRPEIPVECGIDTDMEDDSEDDDGYEDSYSDETDDDEETDSLDGRPSYQAFDCIHEVNPISEFETTELDGSFSTLSLEDRLIGAVRKFGSKQRDSTLQWLQARLRKIEETSKTDLTESQASLERLARSFGYESWITLASGNQLSGPQDLLLLDKDIGQLDEGTRPPAPKEERDDFFERLTTGINQVFDPEAANFFVVPLPEDYKVLLSITDGLRDNDLRGSGVCGIDGIRDADISQMAPDETEKLPCGDDLWQYGWELSTGFLLGKRKDHHWLVYYYCARAETMSDGRKQQFSEKIKDSEREWKWRLFYSEKQRVSQYYMAFPKVFDNIVEWLRFYQGWWDREISNYPAWTADMLSRTRAVIANKRWVERIDRRDRKRARREKRAKSQRDESEPDS